MSYNRSYWAGVRGASVLDVFISSQLSVTAQGHWLRQAVGLIQAPALKKKTT